MHGQNRAEYKARMRDEATAKKLAQKAMQWNALSAELLKRRRQHQQTIAKQLNPGSIDVIIEDEQPPDLGPVPTYKRHMNKGRFVYSNSNCKDDDEFHTTARETLDLTEKMLSIDPDPLHLWNHRRELLTFLYEFVTKEDENNDMTNSPNATLNNSYISSASSVANTVSTAYTVAEQQDTGHPVSPNYFIEQEQKLTTLSLQRNPKAYGAWFHRKWSIRHWLHMMLHQIVNISQTDSSASQQQEQLMIGEDADGDFDAELEQIELHEQLLQQQQLQEQLHKETVEYCKNILQAELQQCAAFLDLDERNFHCWSYRRFVVGALASVELLKYVPDEIDESTQNVGSLEAYKERVFKMKQELDGSWNNISDLIGAQIKKTTTTETDSSVSDSSLKSASSTSLSSSSDVKNLLQAEWDFTTQKINQNFSNGSAFHYRSKLLTILHPPPPFYSSSISSTSSLSSMAKSSVSWSDLLLEELELVGNAIYTEPDDQTPWWYLRFILSWANPNKQSDSGDQSKAATQKSVSSSSISISVNEEEEMEQYRCILIEQLESIRELVEAEEGQCKWGLLGMFMIMSILSELDDSSVTNKEAGGASGDEENNEGEEDWDEQSRGCLEALIELDPDRKARYEFLMKQ